MVVAERKPLGQLLLRPPRYGINAAAVPLTPGVATYIRITDIDGSGRFSPNPKVGVAHASAENYRLASGELVFARTGASVGKSYLYDSHDGELVYAGFLINIAPDAKLLNPKYLSLFAQSKEYWDWVARTSVRSGQPGINGQEYAQLPIPLPDIATQDAVAEAMTDVDELIATLERTIAKKEAIKQGLIQQLLTGRTRLPGFTDLWIDVRLGEISAFITKGATPTTYGFAWESSGVPFLRSECVSERGLDMRQSMFISPAANQALRRSQVADGDILMTITGYVGRVVRLVDVGEANINQHIARVRIKDSRFDPGYVYHYLSRPLMREYYESIVTGQAYPQISLAQVRNTKIPAVPLEEQRAIAAALDDADREIDVLRRRLAKARDVKRGMMQQLLTGRTHLLVKEGTA